MALPLQYLLNTLKVVALEKVSLGIEKIQSLFVNTLTANDKHYLLNREKFTQRIQMQLYLKQKTFAEFFSCISKIYIEF